MSCILRKILDKHHRQMKVTIEFNLPDQQDKFDSFINGSKWKYVVRELDESMREMIKWNTENLDESQLLTVRQIRSILFVYLEQENLRINE